jgi:ADP-dependent NAD(P)H-hydrate dehydratase / NAD(P)H-hydrate epimerase
MPLTSRLPLRLLPGDAACELHDSAASRVVERAALAAAQPHALMERAGVAVARLGLALAPHAERIWVAAGPGNNGGDGLIAAQSLQAAGKRVHITWLGDPAHLPEDAAYANRGALRAGLTLGTEPPVEPVDLAIDALLGLGQTRAPEGRLRALVDDLNSARGQGATVLAVDLPTGLCADTGRVLGDVVVRADATLALLTAKPGLFTAAGRDAAGAVWLDTLGCPPPIAPSAHLLGRAHAAQALAPRLFAQHASHKGGFGDVWVVGGAAGMTGAARLAAQAALHAGAGRVYCSLLGDTSSHGAGPAELMERSWAQGHASQLAARATVVCGCGGGGDVRAVLPALLARASRLVLDADALNAIAADGGLGKQLVTRGERGAHTVLTPHPLEAARLLGITAAQVQADRLGTATALARRFGAVVVLKGSGTVIAATGQPPAINPTGNARLASAGTGDVLAGWLGGCWSTHPDAPGSAWRAAAGSTWLHGRAADTQIGGLPLVAGELVTAMVALGNQLVVPGDG